MSDTNDRVAKDEVEIQNQSFDPGLEIKLLQCAHARVGAVVSFVGVMRDFNDDAQVTSMTLEHYPQMTKKSLEKIVADAKHRWELNAVKVIHRFGEFKPQDPIVFVGVSSQHRGNAFHACEFIMDYLKTQAPFWKKENLNGASRWVESRQSDDDAIHRWQTK